MRVIHEEPISGIASSGTFSVNTSKHIYGLLRQITISPATESTIYSIKILNSSGFIIYQLESCIGSAAPIVQIPIKNINTITIFNSNVDEAFTGQLRISEK